MSNKAVIIDGVRSPIGTKGSPMIGMRSDEIAGQVIKGLLDRNKELDVNLVEDVSLGCAFPEGPTPNAGDRFSLIDGRNRQRSRGSLFTIFDGYGVSNDFIC